MVLIACCEFKDKEGQPLIFTRGRKSPVKLILTIIGSMIAAIFVYVIFLIMIVLYATGGLTDTVQNQLAALRSGDVEKAYYSYTSKDFQTNTSLDDFKKFIDHYPALKNNKSASFTEREVKNSEGMLKGTLKSNDGATTPIEYRLIKERDAWKIIGIQLPAKGAGIETNHTTNNLSYTSSSNESLLPNVYEDNSNKFSIKYPADWEHEQPDQGSIVFSGKKGIPSYYSTVTIQLVPTKKAGGVYENTKAAIDNLKKQIFEQATDVKILDEGPIELPQNPNKFHGEYFIVTYTYQGKSLKKMQFILSSDDGSDFYAWGFTSPVEQYANDLFIAKAMYESWTIE